MYDVVIMGGGIMGMLTAYRLVQAGCLVALVDKSELGTEASWAGGGLLFSLNPWNETAVINRLIAESRGYYGTLCRTLYLQTGIDSGYWQSGALFLDTDKQSCQRWLKENPTEILPFTETSFYFPEFAQIRNSRLMRALKTILLINAKCHIYSQEPVLEIHTDRQRRARAIRTMCRTLEAKQFVVTMGAWTSEFLGESFSPKISPIKGQMIAIQTEPGLIPYPFVTPEGYLIPRGDGLIVVGSTLESVGFDKSLTLEVKDRLYEWACDLIPLLKDYPVTHHWAGLRPAAPQPAIGRIPYYDNVFAAAGHYRCGLTTAPATTALLLHELGIESCEYHSLLANLSWSRHDHHCTIA